MRVLIAVLPALLLSACGYHHTEDSLTPSTRDPRVVALSRVERGDNIRLYLPAERIEGEFLRVDSQTLTLEVRGRPVGISVSHIDSIFVHRSHVATGAIIGAVPVAIAGAFLGLVASSLGCQSLDCQQAETTVGMGLLGAAIGAGVGGLVGFAASGWRPLYVPRASSP